MEKFATPNHSYKNSKKKTASTFKNYFRFCVVCIICFLYVSANAQQKGDINTSQKALMEEVKTLMPYSKPALKFDYNNYPASLSINKNSYKALFEYSTFLSKAFETDLFADFVENCLDYIKSKRIINKAKKPSIFDDTLDSEREYIN